MSSSASSAPPSREPRRPALQSHKPARIFRPTSCSDWLRVVEPHLAEILVPASSRRRLHAAARQLPGGGLVALETRLGPNSDRVDLSVRWTDPAQASRVANRFVDPPLEKFLDRWAKGDPALAPVPSIWIELDLTPDSRALPDPVICARLQGPSERNWLLEDFLPALHGQPLSLGQRRRIERCLDVLPAGAELLYVFSLRARQSDAIRLEFHRLPPTEMVIYLKSLVTPETVDRVAELLPIAAGCEGYHLSIDVEAEIAPRIGVEVSFRRIPDREPGWARLVDRLVERGLCTPHKRAALFAWPGWDSPQTASGRWPESCRRRGTFCARCLSHIKLVSRPNREPEAKAYLLFEPVDKRGQQRSQSATETPNSPASSRARST